MLAESSQRLAKFALAIIEALSGYIASVQYEEDVFIQLGSA